MNDLITECPLKDGRMLTLRRSLPSDAQQILDYLNMVGGESDNLLFGKNGLKHMTAAQEAEYLAKLNVSPNTLSMVGITDGKLVSLSQVRGEAPQRIAHNFELSITVAKEFWGQGIGSIVMAELICFAKEHGGRVIHLGVLAGNDTAVRLYNKFGFEQIGIHRNFFNINGAYHDEIMMDLFLV